MKPLIPNGNLLATIFNGYGDAYLTLPVLRKISRRYKGHKLYLACFTEQVKSIFQDLPFQFVPWNGLSSFESNLNDLDFQQMISFNAYFPCQPELELFKRFPSVERWGFCDLSGRELLAVEETNRHMRDQYFLILGWKPRYTLEARQGVIPLAYYNQILHLFEPWFATHNDRFYVVHPDSLPEKMWPIENWIELVSYIWYRWQAWPLIVGEENEDACKLAEKFDFAYKLPSHLGIVPHFAAVRLAKAFVGIDSIFAHVADSFHKPLITLFGPTNPAVWGSTGPLSCIVKPDHGNKMSDISPTKVVATVDSLFGSVFSDQ